MASDKPPLLLASRSAHKLHEIRALLGPRFNAPILSLDDLAIDVSPKEVSLESLDSFTDNARAKAHYFARLAGLPTLADDSGICVDALDGAPGVRSKRFAARPGLHGTELDRANNDVLLKLLTDLPHAARTARYICALAWVAADGKEVLTLGSAHGLILRAERGHAGFGYDPLFLLPQLGKTFAELDAISKNRFSHRGIAVRALSAILRTATHFPSNPTAFGG